MSNFDFFSIRSENIKHEKEKKYRIAMVKNIFSEDR